VLIHTQGQCAAGADYGSADPTIAFDLTQCM
jgi:hypothetical protein